MRPLSLVVVLAVVALPTAAVANSRPPAPWKDLGAVDITVNGVGSVELSWGFDGRKTLGCAGASCRYVGAGFHRRRVVLTAMPYKDWGWRFVRWRGACRGKRPKCTIDFSHRRRNRRGFYHAVVSASFLPVGPGLTRRNPIRIGHAHNIGNGWGLRINSFTPSVQLSPPPPAGEEYVAANMTVTFCGPAEHCTDVAGSTWPVPSDYFYVIGSHRVAYRPGDCPGDAPPPALVDSVRLSPGQSATGNVCWQVATNDAATLELHTDPKVFYPGLWFALH
jgi:hypothetical protein